MGFKRYMHVEKFGTPNVVNIDMGKCYIFPKIDGTNSSVWWENGVHAGSRNREISVMNDNQGFCSWAVSNERIYDLLEKYPNWRLFGEWLVPHTLKTYREDAWRNFYVFDVMNENDEYISYEEYQPVMEEFGIDYIPPIIIIKNPTYERIIQQLKSNNFLIEDGKGDGEGIVIKRYGYKNSHNNTIWAKIVTSEFKEKHSKHMGAPEVKDRTMIEQEIVDKYVTTALVEKEYAKICNDSGWSNKAIPRLLNTVYYCLVTEELWTALKKLKSPVIDFKRLGYLCNCKTKEIKSDLF